LTGDVTFLRAACSSQPRCYKIYKIQILTKKNSEIFVH